jgi:hypothetical protein
MNGKKKVKMWCDTRALFIIFQSSNKEEAERRAEKYAAVLLQRDSKPRVYILWRDSLQSRDPL